MSIVQDGYVITTTDRMYIVDLADVRTVILNTAERSGTIHFKVVTGAGLLKIDVDNEGFKGLVALAWAIVQYHKKVKEASEELDKQFQEIRKLHHEMLKPK